MDFHKVKSDSLAMSSSNYKYIINLVFIYF